MRLRTLLVCGCLLFGVSALVRVGAALSPDRGLTQALRRIWQAQQGLPDPTIYCVRQLGEGYLYLGTQTGLTRFDGMRFAKMAAVGDTWVQDLISDSSGTLWLATNGKGVLAVRDGVVTKYGREAGLPSENVRQVVVDRSGTLWACTVEGLARFEGGKFTVVATQDAIGTRDVMAGCVGSDGRLWIGGGRRIASWDGKAFTSRVLTSISQPTEIRAMLCGEDGTMWVGTNGGLVRVKDGREQLLTTAEGLADDWVFSLSPGSNGAVFVGTRNGLSRVRGSTLAIDSYQAQDGLSQSTVYGICEDREGSLWVGTKHGLNQFWDGRVIPFTMSEGLPSNDVGPVCDAKEGGVVGQKGGGSGAFVATFGGGLSRFDGHRFTTLTTAEGLSSNTILSLAPGEAGELWVGSDKGVDRLRERKVVRRFTAADGLPAGSVRELYRDHAGVLWAGTASGAAALNGEKFLFLVPAGAEGFARGAVAGFVERGEELLVATGGPVLFGYKDGVTREVARDEMLRGVDTLYEDGDGLVWMGTGGGGLRLLDGGKLTAFTVQDGLFDDEIYGIVRDGDDRLWMACSKGIFYVARSELRDRAAGKIQHVVSTPFSPTEGLRTVECRSGVQPAAWRMGDGRLWFSTIHGVIVIDPKHLQRATGVAPAVIEDVIVNGHREPANQIGTLSAGLKNLEFRYTALSFIVPTRISFRYQLEGFDKEWVEAESRREAFYTNLSPGTFTFRVQARNVEGAWSEAASPVAFTLAPYVYQRWWFWPLCVAAAAAGAWTGYRLRIRAIKGRMNAIVAERSRIARELHDTLLQGFSGVTMEMQALSSRLPASEERGTLVEIIRDAANCMKEARRSVAGLRPPPRGAGAAEGLAAAVGEAARTLTETREVQLKLEVEEGLPAMGAEVEYNLVRIVQEALTNAVKHSGARVIEVSLKRSGGGVRLVVRDDGRGFEQAAGGNGVGGHYGIVGMRERAGAIGGRLEVGSAIGRGTVVEVVLGGG